MSFEQTTNKGSGASLVPSVMPIRVIDDRIVLLDQRKIPETVEDFDATTLKDMCFAIKDMVVRGAPSIGVAGALGLAWEAKRLAQSGMATGAFLDRLGEARVTLESTRPTAVNLRWGLERIHALAGKENNVSAIADLMCASAEGMILEHFNINKCLSDFGAQLVGKQAGILTHCNAGSLATCGWGTALGVILSARLNGSEVTVYTAETRPRQQGMRLTAWELVQEGFEPIIVTDSMAGHLMSSGKIDMVVVGADRIATNGDTANKIGTYNLAVLANYHAIPFYVAAPLSTVDPHIESGKDIPIEEREPNEVIELDGKLMAPPGVKVFNPAFDVTRANLISAIITEAGILKAPYRSSIAEALKTLRS
ncbi:MAG: S-methyl-5-thioribose-1-phosphate isomerase [Candidatus Obscuribacterales bacterium]|nr:S-methyl-5-thioribose-1-phosphate isomerase [Candidatus Obscuribacterales bacterium]